jgi:nucleoside-diphosphate-sugar epimerase
VAGQVFSRVPVDEIAGAVVRAFDAPAGIYNLSDDRPAPQDEVIEHAARLLGMAPPPIVPLAALSPAARAFHAENRRVANGKAKRVLGWRLLYPDYVFGLRALSATTSPIPASTPPAAASGVQR